jgi:hypothetical protein
LVAAPLHLKVHCCTSPPGQAPAAEALLAVAVEIVMSAAAKMPATRMEDLMVTIPLMAASSDLPERPA